MSDSHETSTVARSGLLDGLLTREQLEAETGWRWRTILRNEADGLPVIVIRGMKLYPIDKVRAWILSRVRERKPPQRGRPVKAA